MKYSQKWPHIFLKTKNIFQKQLHIFLISSRSSRTFLKKHEIFSEAAAHKKNMFRTAAQNIDNLREDFHNLFGWMAQ